MQPSSRLRRGLAAAFSVAALATSSGCASNFDSPVLQEYTPSTGINVREGGVWAMNLLVVLPESGPGTLVGALLNQTRRPDALQNATVQTEQGQPPLQSTLLSPGLPLAPGRLVPMSENPTVAVQGDVTPGRFVTLTLTFRRAEPIEVKVPVVAHEGPYAEVPLPPIETASPNPTERELATPVPTQDETPSPAPQGEATGPSPSPTADTTG